jgi:hypothetical protein
MPGAIALLFALTVARDAALRPSCDASENIVATIPAGTPVEIRFAVSDGSNCYKIAASVEGKTLVGYVNRSALSDTNAFDRQRQGGLSLDASRQEGNAPAPAETKPAMGAIHFNSEHSAIVEMLNSHEPGRALERAEGLLKTRPRDPSLLALASIAAYQNDDIRHALEYCKDALALGDDNGVTGFCRKVDRESKADHSGEKLYGLRVALRYEGEALPADVARGMIAVLDEELIRVSEQLGCQTKERIAAIVQSRESYLRATNAAEWSGGLFDGRIHVSLSEGERLGPATRRAFAHEIVHACLANIGTFPAWLHEGLAQRLSGDTLSGAARQQLKSVIGAGSVPKLENISQNWSNMSPENARIAYNLALAAADVLFENYAGYGIRNLLHNPQMMQQITPGLDKALGL